MDHQIYTSDEKTLGTLMDWAGGPQGATLLIPDLQRSYRWQPNQVVALLDSLLRGWPFGTLLVWDVGLVQRIEAAEIIPARAFWAHVDRTDGADGRAYTMAIVPQHFRMVLDGQQRLQSLLLALAGDDSGFKLYDRDWIADQKPGERSRPKDHWTWGQLCLDVDRFVKIYGDAKGDHTQIDYQDQVFRWVVCNARGGISEGRTKAQTVPLPLFEIERYVRLKRLWDIAPTGAPNFHDVRERLKELLETHNLVGERRSEVFEAIQALVLWLGGLKTTKLTFLQVNPPPPDVTARLRYDEAVVSIFTRLNSGGTPLTSQEILFAWIKRKWDSTKTGNRDAFDCFEALRSDLESAGLTIAMDELVRGIAAVWSACVNDGALLGDVEFRRGRRMGDVAPWLAERWITLSEVFVGVAKAVAKKGLEQERHYQSVNSMFVLAAWVFVFREWMRDAGATFREGERARQDEASRLDAAVLHWMLLPQWAGTWQRATSLGDYIHDLGQLRRSLAALHDVDAAGSAWGKMMDTWVDGRRDEALASVQNEHASYRNTLRQYYPFLWAWQLLDEERANLSRIALSVKSRASSTVHVDHIIAYDYWARQIAPGLVNVDIDRLPDGPNALGNCLLLHANFNISKQERPLADLLADVHQFKLDPSLLDRWSSALALDDVHLDARGVPVDDIRAVIATRTERIRNDLARFIRAELDLVTPTETPSPSVATSPWIGRWDSESTNKGTAMVDRFDTILRQEGEDIVGTYEGGTLSARSFGSQLLGKWAEGSRYGRFRWTMSDDANSFDGTWGNGTWGKGRGAWRGSRRKP